MRKLKKFLTAMVSASVVLSFSAVPAWAEENYDYTVTFYAGNQGVFSGTQGLQINSKGDISISSQEDRISISGLTRGDVVSFDINQGAVSLNEESKYYVQGLRMSGRDNDEQLEEPAFWVTGDEDYVVAYGIRGDMTSYTVNYVDESGNELAPSRTYYGNVGDRPVVAYLYMEGYNPETLTLTRTLSANQADNVFTFEYRTNPVEVIPGETVTVTTVEPGTTNVITQQVPVAGTGVTGTGTAGTTGTAAAGTGTAGDAAGAAGTAGTGADAGTGTDTGAAGTDTAGQAGDTAGTTVDGTEAGTTDNGTEEIQDEETPLGQIDLDEGEDGSDGTQSDASDNVKSDSGSTFPMAAGIAVAVVAVAALGGLAYILRKNMKK